MGATMKLQGLMLLRNMHVSLVCTAQPDTVTPLCSTSHGCDVTAIKQQVSLSPQAKTWYDVSLRSTLRAERKPKQKNKKQGGGSSLISLLVHQSFSYAKAVQLTFEI